MNFLNKHKLKIISGAVAAVLLVIAFFIGTPNTEKTPDKIKVTSSPTAVTQSEELLDEETATPDPEQTPEPGEEENTATHEMSADTDTVSAAASGDDTEIVSDSGAKPAEKKHTETVTAPTENASAKSETNTTEKKELTCTLSVRCDTILNNMSNLIDGKSGIIPSNGVIFPKTKVVFNKGESVFNVLTREMKKNKIHLEYVNTPMYNSAYIEGIANIYEHDCGELSGWMYRVNGKYPNYGSSQYKVKNGDTIEWIYTCNGGRDIGDTYSSGNGKNNE